MKRRTKKYKTYQPFIVPVIFVLLAVGTTFATLKYFQKSEDISMNLDGKVAVPASRTEIDAYSKVTRDHITFIHLAEESLPKNAVIDLSDLMGRVMRRDKKKGYIFRKSELFPKGTKEGFTAAIPPGKRAFTLNTKNIQGLESLKEGDRFDLLSVNKPVQSKSSKVKSFVQTTAQKSMTNLIVNNGVVLQTGTMKSKKNKNNLNDSRRKSSDKDYIVAVTFEEIPELLRTLDTNEKMFVLARSGQKEDSEGDSKYSLDRRQYGNNEVAIIETITDKERQSVVVPKE